MHPLTPEQIAIVAHRGNLKINAVAGSGKTSTLLAYAKAQPPQARGLYLAFNRTVKLEGAARFREAGLLQVQVETAHSLAYKHVVRTYGYTVRDASHRAYELAELLELAKLDEAVNAPAGLARNFPFLLGAHIARLLAAFCNSDVKTVRELDYANSVQEPQARAFAQRYSAQIERQARHLLGLMDRGEVAVTHDFYLKKFQLTCPMLGYDYILFDEAQDASGSMLDWFMHQSGTKVMVGDTHQQIYAWRGAINSLEKVDFVTLPLRTSFRFGPGVAALAAGVLGHKLPPGKVRQMQRVPLTGAGKSQAERTRAVIGRSNIGLLVKAISYVTGPNAVQRLYFEGNLKTYIYGAEGASMYDVLNIHLGQYESVRDVMLATMGSLDEVSEYAEQTGDQELLLLIDLVEKYGEGLYGIMKDLKNRQVADRDRAKAQVYFSTVHRCKGMEYDLVELAPDFITAEQVLAFHMRERSPDPPTAAEWVNFNEQINLLYVAITRTKYRLWMPVGSVPHAYPLPPAPADGVATPATPGQELLAYPGPGTTYLTTPGVVAEPKAKRPGPAAAASKRNGRPAPKSVPPINAGKNWKVEEEKLLTIAFCQDKTVACMANELLRPVEEIRQHIKVLQLAERYGLAQ